MAKGSAMVAVLSRPQKWTIAVLHSALGAIESETGDDIDYRRFEIVDGTLLMSPSAGTRHEILVLRLATQFQRSLPADLALAPSVGIDLGESYIVPDLVVVPMSRFDDNTSYLVPAEIPIVVEIVSPSSTTMDRVTKPALYAAAGIAHYWRVETRPDVTITAYELDGDAYRELGAWGPGEVMNLDAPFPLTVSLDELNR